MTNSLICEAASKRGEFSVRISCPKCRQGGSVIWEENLEVSARGPERALKLLSGGFHLGSGKTMSGDPQIICDHCDTILPD